MRNVMAPWRAALLLSALYTTSIAVCAAKVDLSSASDHGALRGLQQLGGLSGGSSSSSSSGSSSSGNSSTTAAAGPETVSTAEELVAAVTSGAEDIRVTDHMDLTGLPGYGVLDPGVVPTWNLRSIRGDCEDPVPTALPAASMRALKPRQCLVVLDKPLVIVTSGGLWLDNLYIQEADDTDFALVSQLETPSELFLTSCTFQGTSGVTAGPSIGGLLAKNAYAGGCDFVDLVGVTARPVVLEPHDGTTPLASFNNCTFENPALASGSAPTITIAGGGSVRLEDCVLRAEGNSSAAVATLVDTDGTGTFYSDDATLEVQSPAGARRRVLQSGVQGLDDVPDSVEFLSGDSTLISAAREANPDPEGVAPVDLPAEEDEDEDEKDAEDEEEDEEDTETEIEVETEENAVPQTTAEQEAADAERGDEETDDEDGGSRVGIAVGVIAVAVAACLIGLCIWKRRKSSPKPYNQADGPGTQDLANYYGTTEAVSSSDYSHAPPPLHPEPPGGTYMPNTYVPHTAHLSDPLHASGK